MAGTSPRTGAGALRLNVTSSHSAVFSASRFSTSRFCWHLAEDMPIKCLCVSNTGCQIASIRQTDPKVPNSKTLGNTYIYIYAYYIRPFFLIEQPPSSQTASLSSSSFSIIRPQLSRRPSRGRTFVPHGFCGDEWLSPFHGGHDPPNTTRTTGRGSAR